MAITTILWAISYILLAFDGPQDQKICFSRRWSCVNILVSSIALVVGMWMSLAPVTLIAGPLYFFAILFTIKFLHFDPVCCTMCCFCDCCLDEEQVVIHDPSDPEANLVWRDGQVNSITKIILKLNICIYVHAGCVSGQDGEWWYSQAQERGGTWTDFHGNWTYNVKYQKNKKF